MGLRLRRLAPSERLRRGARAGKEVRENAGERGLGGARRGPGGCGAPGPVDPTAWLRAAIRGARRVEAACLEICNQLRVFY